MVTTQSSIQIVQPSDKTLPIAAMILGIISIVVPFIGVVAAILAIIFAIISLHRKTTHRGFAIAGIATGAFGILMTIVAFSLVALFIAHPPTGNILFPTGGKQTALVKAQEAEQKDFKIGQTTKIGGVDMTIQTVQRNYVPTVDEMKVIDLNSSQSENDPRGKGYPALAGGTIADEEAEYVRVDGTANYNGSETAGDNNSISDTQLNNVYPALFNENNSRYNTRLTNEPSPISFVYRIRKDSSTLTMKYVATVYTSISWLVGTEGAPTKNFTYTITLN
jgi:hypothetical protein